ncbi:MAG: ISAzo13-like element transposase-related protein, partial [Actinomycetota bacterium]
EVVVNLIGATKTRSGLKVHAHRDRASYPTGLSVTDAQLAAVPSDPHQWHRDWNYTVAPRK